MNVTVPSKTLHPDGHESRVAVLFIFFNCLFCVFYYRMELSTLLSSAVDQASPDMPSMQVAFMGFILYAVALVSFLIFVLFFMVHVLHTTSMKKVSWYQAGFNGLPLGLRVNPSRPLLIFLVTGLAIFVFVETEVFGVYGIHFYQYDLLSLLTEGAGARDLGISAGEIREGVVAVVVVIAVETLIYFLARSLTTSSALRWAPLVGLGLAFALVSGFSLYNMEKDRVWVAPNAFFESMPFRSWLTFESSYWPHIAVEPRLGRGGYPVLEEKDSFPVIRDRKNIVILIADGWRADMALPGQGLMPHLSEFSHRPSVIRPETSYSVSHFTAQGLFGILYGLDGYHFHPFARHNVPSYPLEVLRKNGYRLALIDGTHLNKYPTNFMVEGMDETRIATDDDDALQLFSNFLEERKADRQPYCVVVFLFTPHYPFPAKQEFRRFKPNWHDTDFNRDYHKGVLNTYQNSVIQLDEYFRQAYELIRKDYDEARTAFVVTSDHGTELWDHGLFGHGRSTFWNEKIQVPLLMGLPGTEKKLPDRSPAMASHTDLWPTLLDYLKADPLPSPVRYASGLSLLAPASFAKSGRKPLFIAGRYFPFTNRPNALVTEDRKYWVQVSQGPRAGSLQFDLERVTDLQDRDRDSANRTIRNVRGKLFDRTGADFWRFLEPSPEG